MPWAYDLHARIVGSSDLKRRFVDEILRPPPGGSILDIGCGTADLLPYMPQVDYVGFDASAAYINAARARFGDRAQFRHQHITPELANELPKADLVMAIGVLHHLDDATAADLFRIARAALAPGGRVVTCDGTYAEGQNPLARFLISLDRGEHVRDAAGYEAIARRVFGDVRMTIRHDLSRIPYTHCIIEASS